MRENLVKLRNEKIVHEKTFSICQTNNRTQHSAMEKKKKQTNLQELAYVQKIICSSTQKINK